MRKRSYSAVVSVLGCLILAFTAACSGQSGVALPRATIGDSLHLAPAVRGKIRFYNDLFGDPTPAGIVSGPDGALWFTDPGNDVIGRIATDGTYSVQQQAGTEVDDGITVGPDNNLWFTLGLQEGGIGRITTAGKVTLYPDPGGSYTQEITTATDGLWFTEDNGTVGHRTGNGKIQRFKAGPSNAELGGIAQGPDGNLWIAQFALGSHVSNKILRLSRRGKVTSYTVGSGPQSICVGPDKALWFTESESNAIGRLTTAGTLTEYQMQSPHNGPYGIAKGPDGALWFTDFSGDGEIGRLTTSGKFTYYTFGSGFTSLSGIAAGPDGAMWFASEMSPSGIGRVSVR
jgi:streptogramin lyase